MILLPLKCHQFDVGAAETLASLRKKRRHQRAQSSAPNHVIYIQSIGTVRALTIKRSLERPRVNLKHRLASSNEESFVITLLQQVIAHLGSHFGSNDLSYALIDEYNAYFICWRSSFLARSSLDLTAATETERDCAISFIERSPLCRSSTTSRCFGRIRRIAFLSLCSFCRRT